MIIFLFHHTPLFFMTQSFWRDEAYTAILSALPLGQIMKITAGDFNPPLYYFIMHYWMKLFGQSEVIMRSFSFICYALTILGGVLIVEFVGRIRSKWLYVYGVLLAMQPVLLYYAFEARMYSLLAMLATYSWYFFLLKKRKSFIFISILGLYTHYFFVFVLACQAMVELLKSKREVVSYVRNYLLIPIFIFLPWFIYVLPHLFTKTSDFWIPFVTISDFPAALGMFFTGYERVWGFYDRNLVFVSISILFLTLYLLYTQRSFIVKDRLAKALVLWTFLPFCLVFFLSLMKPVYVPRYIIFCNVGFTLLISYLAHREKILKRMIIIGIVIVLSWHYTSFEVRYKHKDDIRTSVSEINRLIDKDHMLYLQDPRMYFTVVYYYPSIPVYIYKDEDHTPSYVGLSLIPSTAFKTSLPLYPQKAILLERNGKSEGVSIY